MEVLLLPNVNVCGLFFWIRDFPLYINKVLWLISQILFIRTSQIFYLFIFFVQYALRRRPQWCNGYSQPSVWKCFFLLLFHLSPLKIPPEWVWWLRKLTQVSSFSLLCDHLIFLGSPQPHTTFFHLVHVGDIPNFKTSESLPYPKPTFSL